MAEAEELEADDDDLEAEYARIAVQVREKPNAVRKAYERNDAVPELRWELRKRKALDWVLEHLEIVDPDGTRIDRAAILPHARGARREHTAPWHGHDARPRPRSRRPRSRPTTITTTPTTRSDA